MNIVLATGIYPPDLGGPATYTHTLARELAMAGHDVTVVSYGEKNDERREGDEHWWTVVTVRKGGGPLLRWRRFAAALKRSAHDASIVEAFSSISTGVPLMMSGLLVPKRVLRLGGDFFWERYTDNGGTMGLADWMTGAGLHRAIMTKVLRGFDHIVFSTAFQRELYGKHYVRLPASSVIENAVPDNTPVRHTKHDPLRLLFVGRLVKFKNLAAFIFALTQIDDLTLTIAGSGPDAARLQKLADDLRLEHRVVFRDPVHGDDKTALFAEHDLLVLPSITEISPNVALEARSQGLPVLLTEATGLSEYLREGMITAPMITPQDIVTAVRDADSRYADIAADAAALPPKRSWADVAQEHVALFQSLR